MPLFQNNIINKYLQAQNQALVAQQWAVYQKHFHNPHVQDNIRGSKEERWIMVLCSTKRHKKNLI